MADENEEGLKKEDFKASPQKNPLAALMLIINAIVLGVIGYMQFQFHESQKKQPSINDVVKAEMKNVLEENAEGKTGVRPKEDEGKLFPLDTFTANLAQGDGPTRFLRLNAVLKFNKTSKEEEYNARKPQIRDVIISILNSKRPDELLHSEGKNFLKDEIKAAINAFLIDGKVEDVYYTSFQVQ